MSQKETTTIEREHRRRLNEEAAAWCIRIQNGDVSEDDAAYLDWVSATPDHAAAMRSAAALWAMFGEGATSPEIMKARRDALDQTGRTAARRWSAFRRSPRMPKLAAAAAAAVLAATPAIIMTTGRQDSATIAETVIAEAVIAETYRTAIAETRVVTLADNSRVSLDALTVLSVNYTEQGRDIELIEGQAHFDVARDLSRPFRVTAGDQTVVATGTAFNVELVGDEVLVTLLEGEVVVTDNSVLRAPDRRAEQVSVDPASAPAAPVKMRPGQLLVASVQTAPRLVDDTNIEKTNAWRDGMVFLEGDSFSAAVARMNRYSRIELTVADHTLSDLRISGVFNAGDTDAFVEAVQAYFPIEARRVSASRIEFHPRT